MALVNIPRSSLTCERLAELQIIYDLWNEEAWVKKVFTSGSLVKPLLIYRNPATFYGGGVYEFPESVTGYYSSTGADKLTVMSGFRYKWISYWALNAEGMRACGLSNSNIQELFGISRVDNLDVRDIVTQGLGTYFESTSIPFYNVNINVNFDAFPELTPSDSQLNRYPYVIELFQDLLRIGQKANRVNNAIWATQLSQENGQPGLIGGYFRSSDKTLTLIARQCYIIREDRPNICPQPFCCFVTSGRQSATDPTDLGSNFVMWNIHYLGVEPT